MTLIEFEIRVAADHPSLAGHFPGQPIVPGVLLLDQVLSAAGQATGTTVLQVVQAKFTSALQPGEAAMARCEWSDDRLSFRVTTARTGQAVAVASGSLKLAPPTGSST